VKNYHIGSSQIIVSQGGGNVATLIILILVMLLPAVIAEYGRYKGWWY